MMTIIVPGIMLFLSGGRVAFGGAKPVPVDVRRLRNPQHDLMWIAAAGPISNAILAALLALSLNGVRVLHRFDPVFAERIAGITLCVVQLNVLLVLFNLLPIPPLDGSKILAAFLPKSIADDYMALGAQGMLVVGALAVSGALSGLSIYVERITLSLVKLCLF
jgi:Zn-dependent protease